jgi:hypothetical protein
MFYNRNLLSGKRKYPGRLLFFILHVEGGLYLQWGQRGLPGLA